MCAGFSARTMIKEWRFLWWPLIENTINPSPSFPVLSIRVNSWFITASQNSFYLYYLSFRYFHRFQSNFWCQCKLTLLYLNRNTHSRLTGNVTMLHRTPIVMLSAVTSINPSTSGTCWKLKPFLKLVVKAQEKFKPTAIETTLTALLETIRYVVKPKFSFWLALLKVIMFYISLLLT